MLLIVKKVLTNERGRPQFQDNNTPCLFDVKCYFLILFIKYSLEIIRNCGNNACQSLLQMSIPKTLPNGEHYRRYNQLMFNAGFDDSMQ